MRLFSIAIFILLITTRSMTITAQDGTSNTPSDLIPDAVPLIDGAGDNITNILLLGSDTTNPLNSGRTDVIMIVSINQTVGAVALLSIPRDLYVYIPDWKMAKINTAYGYGESLEEGNGAQLLGETIEYNLGLRIDRYARVDFIGFKYIVDALGGIRVPVDCAIQDWRLREPDLDPTQEDNWEMFTLPIGMQLMDGDLALWYVRSRRTSNDIDRGQRQQDVVRALWQHIRNLGLIGQISELWSQMITVVETDITLNDMLSLSALALNLDPNLVTSFSFELNQDVVNRLSDEGSQILVPQSEMVEKLMQYFMTPPTASQVSLDRPTVKITNATGDVDLGQVVANRMVSSGFLPILADGIDDVRPFSQLVDYTGSAKGGRKDELMKFFRLGESQVIQEPRADRQYDYEVILGQSFYACTRNVLPPD